MVYLPTFTIKTSTNHVGKYTSPMNPRWAMVKNKWSNHETLRTTTFVVDSDFYALLSPRQVSWKSRKLRVVFGKNIISLGKKHGRCRGVRGKWLERIHIYMIIIYIHIYISFILLCIILINDYYSVSCCIICDLSFYIAYVATQHETISNSLLEYVCNVRVFWTKITCRVVGLKF